MFPAGLSHREREFGGAGPDPTALRAGELPMAQPRMPGLGMPQQWEAGSSVLGTWECSFMDCHNPGGFGGCWPFPHLHRIRLGVG